MPDATGTRSQRAMQAIQAYLARHPSAGDNEQGIAQWWLPEMNVEASVAEVRMAVQQLVRRQVLVCTTLPDGSAIYRAATQPAAGRRRSSS